MMLKNVTVLIILILSLGNPAYAQNFKEKPQNITIPDPAKELSIGERLEYSVEWLGVPVAKIRLKVEGITTINNYECYHITAEVFPNRFFQRFYDLEYKVDSYIDKLSFLPIRFEKVRRLNKQANYVTIDFDHERNEAKYKTWGSTLFINISPMRQKLETINPTTTHILKGTQDLFSSFYYFRIFKIEEGQSYPVNIYYGQRNWLVKMNVDKPFFREMRKKGIFAAVKLSPISELNDYILGKRNFFVYLTIDSRRIPLEFGLNTAMGPIRGIIENPPK
ncbi:MAG: DUF3108 domain-containing protein [Candidatus Omnitrophota bacterium]|nr:DUF3108 domain-containing protein [Candidatus Omnitrophota bacterium]